jgi:hypothetical protein
MIKVSFFIAPWVNFPPGIHTIPSGIDIPIGISLMIVTCAVVTFSFIGLDSFCCLQLMIITIRISSSNFLLFILLFVFSILYI